MYHPVDLIVSACIGGAAALLIMLIARNIPLPALLRRLIIFLPLVFPAGTLTFMLAGSYVGVGRPVIYQLTKFILVGGLNFLIDLGILNVLIHASGRSRGFIAVVFKAIAFSGAVVSSFFFNKLWTFQSVAAASASRQFFLFLGVSLGGLLLNTATFYLANDKLGRGMTMSPKTWANISAILAALVGLAWNFFGYKFFVF